MLNIGIDRETKIGDVVALDINSGQEVWRHQYSGEPVFAFLHEELFYLIEGGVITRLLAATGEVEKVLSPQLGEDIIVAPAGEELIIGSNDFNTLNRYSVSERKVTSSVLLPDEYVLDSNGIPVQSTKVAYFNFMKDHPSFSYSSRAVNAIDKDEVFKGQIEPEPPLVMPMMVSEDKNGEIVYLFTVSCDSLDDLRRMASIQLAEFAYTYGSPGGIVPIIAPDEKHKGKIKLVVDASVLPKDAEEVLNEWTEALADNFATMQMFPGAGEKYRYCFEIEMSN